MARWKRLLKTWTSLFCVTAVCILLNLLGSKLNGALGLPLYLDNIGTILAALLGGYIPCVTVGFMSNLIGGLSDSVTMYYCIIIEVFINIDRRAPLENLVTGKYRNGFKHIAIGEDCITVFNENAIIVIDGIIIVLFHNPVTVGHSR